ncbi:MAG: hypothetical protein IJ290_08035 [Bacteroidaceae bacterium]|nr:hypothetical protein [Bacteroidaceae bacterium]
MINQEEGIGDYPLFCFFKENSWTIRYSAGQTHKKKLAQVIEFHTDLTNLTKAYTVEATPLAPHSFGKINLPSSQPTLILRVGVCAIRLKTLGEADKRGRSDAPL